MDGVESSGKLIGEIALPFLLSNSIGFALMSLSLQMVYRYRKTEEHEKQISTELGVATKIQVDMLPTIFPNFPGRKEFDLSASMTPAKEVGGDFYDFFFVDKDHFAFLIGDVSGKGVPAALFMVISKTVIKNGAMEGRSAADTLTKANKELLEGNKEGMFVTVWLGILEISTGKLDYACAGHNPPLIETEGEGFQYLKKNSGFILAGMENTKYKGFETTLHKGDKILLYTDGVTEAMNEEKKQYGEDRLKDLLDTGKTKDS